MSVFSRDFEFFTHLSSKGLSAQDIVQHAESIETMISKYSTGLDDDNIDPPRACERSSRRPPMVNETVLLTGSTGNLGCYILASLLSRDDVHCVYTFNRRSTNRDILERHKAQFEEKGLDIVLLSSPKLVFLEGNIELPSLGLTEKVIMKLQQELTAIIHNAWLANLSLPLSAFDIHIQGTCTLIDMARLSERRNEIRFLFTSSISMTQNWDECQGPYPETLVMDAITAVGIGYGESKYVAERETNWMTMDAISDIALELVFHKDSLPFAANLTHPQPVGSAFILRAVRDALIQELGHALSSECLRQVSVEEWIDMLEQSARRHRDEPQYITRILSKIIHKIPPFTTLDISNAMKLSERMRTLRPLDAGLVLKWVKFWIASGKLSQLGFGEDRHRAHL
ncbi:male sterility protein-domain-containing protein [Lentinula raphanica]|nr:male sterility protein-domain-containing protein [Lentinula raphanica]